MRNHRVRRWRSKIDRWPTFHAHRVNRFPRSRHLLIMPRPCLVGLLLALFAATWGCHLSERSVSGTVLPTVVVTHDDTIITQSCWIEIPPGLVIADTNGDGVLHLNADQITVRFKPGSQLRGAPVGTPWDQLTGIGIRLDGHRGVRIEGGAVHGFRAGMVATRADDLVVSGGDYSDNYRQHLKSTTVAEDGADWLFPHHNDETKWRDEYGGAVCIESSSRVAVHDIRVRRGQNGMVLDRVNDSAIYDNDCSFLSGWGLALWRSSRNQIGRNAFDFCVRGHVEGVYNRGQDSAGILCFEQCNDNVFAENSATHGGDCFFGFAGHEAIGEDWMNRERERLRKETGMQEVDDLIHPPADLVRTLSPLGCNRNLLIGNDFSYSPAHGIEMTFSEGNRFIGNRLVENAICGVWGGYSSDTVIAGNEFTGNGGMAYGLERGAVNMEHAAGNLIVSNRFVNNKAAVHLWWNESPLMKFPGVTGTERGVTGNSIVGNWFEINREVPFAKLGRDEKLVVLQLRDSGRGHVTNNLYSGNQIHLTHPQAVEFALMPGTEPLTSGSAPRVVLPNYTVPGKHHPVGARVALRGRGQILMDEWGPWDHETPMIRPGKSASGEPQYDLFGMSSPVTATVLSGDVTPVVEPGSPARVRLRGRLGVNSYRVRLAAGGFDREVSGTFLRVDWKLKVFPWTATTDPREHLVEWRRLADGPEAFPATAAALDFPYAMGGPRSMNLSEEINRRGPGNDHFGMVATARLPLPAGSWRITTLSDDGVRVQVDGRPVIENWAWHGPTTDTGTFVQSTAGEVELLVEHFEIDGYSVLRVEIERAGD